MQIYGKVFEDLFCSTLMDCGGDTAYVFIAMIVLSDESGVIKHTAESLSRAICKDAESVKKALYNLERQDPLSNLKAHGGRRIVPLSEVNEDETRGWLVVNKTHYRDKKDIEVIRAQTRERVRNFRDRNATKRGVTICNAEKRHTDTDTDTDTDTKTKDKEVALRLPEWLPLEAWKPFLEMRRKKKIANGPRALNMLVAELERLKSLGNNPVAVIDQSTMKGWTSFYPLKVEVAAMKAEPIAKLCDYCAKVATGMVNGRRACDVDWDRAMGNEPPMKVAA